MIEFVEKHFNLPLSKVQMEQFETLCDQLLYWNERFNLTAITDKNEIINKHFIDSLAGARFISDGSVVCDIGSGCGMPAIPLMIARKDIDITMVDSRGKKVEFLKNVTDLLQLKCNCLSCRIEEIPHREYYNCVTARAVAPTPVLLEYAAPLLKVGGRLIAYKTPDDNVDCEHALTALNMEYESRYDYVLPDGASRSILLFVKYAPTDSRYPRPNNLPRKKPL